MSCKQCSEQQQSDTHSYYRWKTANIEVRGCSKHLEEIYVALNLVQNAMVRDEATLAAEQAANIRESVERDLRANVPIHTMNGIDRYIKQRMMPGDFLVAVLTNDLKAAFDHADLLNLNAIPHIVRYLYNCAPSICWGSEERYKVWVEGREDWGK